MRGNFWARTSLNIYRFAAAHFVYCMPQNTHAGTIILWNIHTIRAEGLLAWFDSLLNVMKRVQFTQNRLTTRKAGPHYSAMFCLGSRAPYMVACEQAPSEVWKKDSASEERDSVSEASGPRPTRFARGVTLFASRIFFTPRWLAAGSLFAGYLYGNALILPRTRNEIHERGARSHHALVSRFTVCSANPPVL